jgi:ubiquinone biosynthesis protein
VLDTLVKVLIAAALIAALAWFGGRLLGIRQSWGRGLIASVLGVGAAAILALAVAPQNPLPYPLFFLLIILLPSLLISMTLSALLELLVEPGPLIRVEGRLTRVPHPIRAIRRWYERERRYSQITWIAARHGLATALQRRRPRSEAELESSASIQARNLRDALVEAGGVFVKLGQVLSTRDDLLPEEVTTELSGLQDNVPPAPQDAIENLITTELGAPPAVLFASFESAPVAAASIAQVYRARLLTGEQVAVKVQRPDIAPLVERDLDIITRLARIAESSASWGRASRVTDLADGFAAALREETDFRIEARNMRVVTAALGQSETVHIPKVYDQLSTRRVLVIEWLDGVSIRDAAPLMAELGLEPAALARELLDATAQQIMRSGVFHADLHPGNVFVLRNKQLGLLDFGSVGRIDQLEQTALRDLLYALQRRDVVELRIALLALASPQVDLDAEAHDEMLERELGQLMAQALQPGEPLDASIFTNLLQLLQDHNLAFPPEIGAVFRAAVTLEGTLRVLAPGFQLMEEAQKLATRWMSESLVPPALARSVNDQLQSLLPILKRLPRRLDRITEVAERGSLTLKVRLFADARDERVVTTIASRAIIAFLGAAIGLMSVLLLGVSGGPIFYNEISLFQIVGYLGLCASVILIMRVVIAVLRDRAV